MGRLSKNKELKELKFGEEELVVTKTGIKNNITKIHKYSGSKGSALIATSSPIIGDEGKKYRTTIVDLEIADLIVKYDIGVGYDSTKDTGIDGATKGYFVAYYKGKKQKLHRMVYKYLNENMSIEDIFNNKASKCDGKEIHHLSGLTLDNQYENLKLTETSQEHKDYQKNVSTHICLDQNTNKYTMKENFKSYIWTLKMLNKDLKGELPKDNEDYKVFYEELKEYAKINEDILYQEDEINLHFKD